MSDIREQLKDLREYEKCKGFPKTTRKIFSEAADTIESLSAKLQTENTERSTADYEDGWIECKEKLPPQPEKNPLFDNKPSELYLVHVKGGNYPFRAFWNGKFFSDGLQKVDAVLWMPMPELPEPYKPQ